MVETVVIGVNEPQVSMAVQLFGKYDSPSEGSLVSVAPNPRERCGRWNGR